MKLFIINGLPGSGKSTFGKLVAERMSTAGRKFIHTSSIDPVKQLLLPKETWNPSIIDPALWSTLETLKRSCITEGVDWDGQTKDQFWRKAMSDLKYKITESMPLFLPEFVMKQISALGDDAVGFVDIREPENIEALRTYCRKNYPTVTVKTVLVRSNMYDEGVNNASDNAVLNYDYDIEIDNKRPANTPATETMQLLEEQARLFSEKILN